MIRHPADEVPRDMPAGLDRVYAALEPDPAPPEELLGRILASRIAGEQVILPSDNASRSRFRVRVIRGAIAAMLGLVALATWSRWSTGRLTAPSPGALPALGSLAFDPLGIATPLEAQQVQGTGTPRYEPIILEAARLRAFRLTYEWRGTDSGVANAPDTVAYSLTRSTDPDARWILAMDRKMTDTFGHTAAMTDTVGIDPATLKVLDEVYRVVLDDQGSHYYRWDIRGTAVRLHEEDHTVHYRPIPSGKERTGMDHRVHDSTYTLPPTDYPRIVSAMNSGGELVVSLMAAPLTSGWKRSLVITPPGGTQAMDGTIRAITPIDLEVVGTERPNVLGVATECWKLRRPSGSAESTYLVRKADGVLVGLRTEGTFNGRKFVRSMQLIGAN